MPSILLAPETLPGMTPTSLLPKIADSAGIDYPSLCEAILEGATLHASLGAQARPQPGSRISHVQILDESSGVDLELERAVG